MLHSLADWLTWLEGLHPREIELGLERVSAVHRRLGTPCVHPAIVVAGTNGKGSCVAYAEAVLRALGKSTAAYTSPHLLHYNERLRIDGAVLPDTDWCAAFEAVAAALDGETLTYFEFGTLAALWLAARAGVDCQILEVGLGGRLDAVNIVDAEVSVITNIALDHGEWLGNSRQAIGVEKAGVMRAGRPVICGDLLPPASVVEVAEHCGADLRCVGRDFGIEPSSSGQGGQYTGPGGAVSGLRGMPEHQRRNAACALAAVASLGYPMDADAAVADAINAVALVGRGEIIPGDIAVMLDVAHNPDAVACLARQLDAWTDESDGPRHRIHAVFSALCDKPIAEMAGLLAQRIHAWYVGGMESVPRGLSATALIARMPDGLPARGFGTVADAWQSARAAAGPGDLVLVFGSFYTLAQVLEAWDER